MSPHAQTTCDGLGHTYVIVVCTPVRRVANRGGSTSVLPYHRIASPTCRTHCASAPSPCSLYGDASDTVACRPPSIYIGMDDAVCGNPPRHRRAAGVLHEGHRLASSDERTPARHPLWGSELTKGRRQFHAHPEHGMSTVLPGTLTRVFAGKASTASGPQRSPRRGLDEGDGARGETRDYLWRICVLANIITPVQYATTVCAVVPGSRMGSAPLAIASRQPRLITHAHAVHMACSVCRTTGS